MMRFCASITGAAGLFALCLSGAASGQCVTACGNGNVSENELCVSDDADRANEGCSAEGGPFVFFNVPSLPTVVCGTSSTDVEKIAARDTDWLRITQAQLTLADTDANGIVQVRALLRSQFPGVTAIFGLGSPVCSDSPVLSNVGFSAANCGGGPAAKATIEIADHPNGVAVFVAPGNPDGSGIFTGFSCADGLNDYTVLITLPNPPTACGPASGPCAQAHAGGGCEDPNCCKLVCEVDPTCCNSAWDNDCVNTAVSLGCAFTCQVQGSTQVSESDSGVILAGNSAACIQQGTSFTSDNTYARSYDLGVLFPGNDFQVTCVAWGIEEVVENVAVPNVVIGLYAVNDGIDDLLGTAPPANGLTLLGSATVTVPAGFGPGFITVNMNNLLVPADTVLAVTLQVPNLVPVPNGLFVGSNNLGQSGTSYLLANGCGVPTFLNVATIGAPNMHLVNYVLGNELACEWDCQPTPDNNVGINDLLSLLSQWGGAGSCDFDGAGVGITDLLKLLSEWGPCL